jgi:hypothetical protein
MLKIEDLKQFQLSQGERGKVSGGVYMEAYAEEAATYSSCTTVTGFTGGEDTRVEASTDDGKTTTTTTSTCFY